MSFWKLNIACPKVSNGSPSAKFAPLDRTSSYVTACQDCPLEKMLAENKWMTVTK